MTLPHWFGLRDMRLLWVMCCLGMAPLYAGELAPVPVNINYDKAIWSGLSWAVGEIKASLCQPGVPVNLRCRSAESKPVQLKAELYVVSYR